MKKYFIALLLIVVSIASVSAQSQYSINCTVAKISFFNETTQAFDPWENVDVVTETSPVMAIIDIDKMNVKINNSFKDSFDLITRISVNTTTTTSGTTTKVMYKALSKDNTRVILSIVVTDKDVVVVSVMYKDVQYMYGGKVLSDNSIPTHTIN